jgi:hypothetical protein
MGEAASNTVYAMTRTQLPRAMKCDCRRTGSIAVAALNVPACKERGKLLSVAIRVDTDDR